MTNFLNDSPDEVSLLDSNWSSVDLLDSGNENYPQMEKYIVLLKPTAKGHDSKSNNRKMT